MGLTMASSGLVTSSTASGAFNPLACTMMSTIGTLICGSSSRGMVSSATRPAASAAIRNSGVNGERIVARVSRPENPRVIHSFGRMPDLPRSWRYQDVAVPDAGEDLHPRGRQCPPLHRCFDHRTIRLAQPDIIQAKARQYILGWHHEALACPGIDPHTD